MLHTYIVRSCHEHRTCARRAQLLTRPGESSMHSIMPSPKPCWSAEERYVRSNLLAPNALHTTGDLAEGGGGSADPRAKSNGVCTEHDKRECYVQHRSRFHTLTVHVSRKSDHVSSRRLLVVVWANIAWTHGGRCIPSESYTQLGRLVQRTPTSPLYRRDPRSIFSVSACCNVSPSGGRRAQCVPRPTTTKQGRKRYHAFA